MADEAVRQHYRIATGMGLTPPPNPNPKPNYIKPGKNMGTAKNPFPNPMTTRPRGRG